MGDWSPIHLLSIFTAVTLPIGVLHAKHHRVKQHRTAMISLLIGALIVAGIFYAQSWTNHARSCVWAMTAVAARRRVSPFFTLWETLC